MASKRQSYSYQSVAEDEEYAQSFEDDDDLIVDDDEGHLKFSGRPNYQDWPAAFLFFIQVAANIIALGLAASTPYSAHDSSRGYFTFEERHEVFEMSIVSCFFGFLLGLFLLGSLFVIGHAVPISVHGATLMFVVNSIVFFAIGPAWLGWVFLVIGGGNFYHSVSSRKHVTLSSSLMRFVTGLVRTHPTLALVAIVGSTIQLVWVVGWSYLAIGLLSRGHTISTVQFSLMLVSLDWTTRVVRGVMHATVGGVVSVWYFMHETGVPLHITRNSLARALSAIGSICFVSLFIGPLRLLRFCTMPIWQARGNTSSTAVSCYSQLLDRATRSLNTFGITHIAMYGKSCVQSSRDAWTAVHNRGLGGVMNSTLVTTAVTLLATTTGLFSAMCGALWAHQHDQLSVFHVASLCFLTAYCVAETLFEVVPASLFCLVVCYAEDPTILGRADPVLAHQIQEACSDVSDKTVLC